MTSPRLSPAMRNMLARAIAHGGLPARTRHPIKTEQTLQALRQRGLLDEGNQPTPAGRSVFAPPEERRPGIELVAARVRAERPNWTDAHVATHAKYLYTVKGARC